MAKKVSSNTHGSKTRERVSVPQKAVSARAQRRADKREFAKLARKSASHDKRAVKFHF